MKRKAINKKKSNVVKKKSNFLKHESLMVKGEDMKLEGWLDASRECRDSFGRNASAYARASVTESHSVQTIRQYVGVGLKALKRWGNDSNKIRNGFMKDSGYAYTNMDDLRTFFISLENGKNEKKPVRKVRTITVTPNKVRSVLAKNGVPKSVIDKVVADLA